MPETLQAFTRTAVEQAALGDGIAIVAGRIARQTAATSTKSPASTEQVYARKLSSETRTMTVRMGKKFAEMGAEVIGAPLLASGAIESTPAPRPAATRYRWP
jgi:urease accessory protein